MQKILQHRGLRLIFAANMVSMLGSGLNSAAVTWHILQATHSEINLAYMIVLQTVPAALLLPFSGVLIDREDRRRLVMMLDAVRGLVILAVAVLAFRGEVRLWQLYLMNTLVAAGFLMFWPTITALVQELTPESEFVQSNTFLMAGIQGGFLISGSIVGFLYNHIGLGGVLLIDVGTYVVSFLLYLNVRKGRHVVERPASTQAHSEGASGAVARFVHEMHEGMDFLRTRPAVVLVGTSWALFLGAMLTQAVITAPLSDRILGAGAEGYGWMNGAWGVGAFLAALYTPRTIARYGARAAVAVGMAVMALGMLGAPFSGSVAVAVLIFFLMGSARGLGGIALSSGMMEAVPKFMMGRVQNTFYFAGMVLQLALGMGAGIVAHRWSLTAAFAMVAAVYLVASVLAIFPGQKVANTVAVPDEAG